MTQYRRHLLGCKRKWGTARGLIHYRALLSEYLSAKRDVIADCALTVNPYQEK